jgi:hypothetical protein
MWALPTRSGNSRLETPNPKLETQNSNLSIPSNLANATNPRVVLYQLKCDTSQ